MYPNKTLSQILKTIVIHHEGNNQTYDVYSIQIKHMFDKGYYDIGYHYIVGTQGEIFEGRDIGVRGTHVDKGNTGLVGVLLLGDFQPGLELSLCGIPITLPDFDDSAPTELQIQSTLHLIRWLDYEYGINRVVGHREINETECPGDYCMPYIRIFNEAAQEF